MSVATCKRCGFRPRQTGADALAILEELHRTSELYSEQAVAVAGRFRFLTHEELTAELGELAELRGAARFRLTSAIAILRADSRRLCAWCYAEKKGKERG